MKKSFSTVKFIFFSLMGITTIILAIIFGHRNGFNFFTFSNTVSSVISKKTSVEELGENFLDSLTTKNSIESSNDTNFYQPLAYTGEFQLSLGELDDLNRATYAHIQLKKIDKPKDERETKITYDPVGWHNYKFNYIDDKGNKKQAWLMNRGHLVGYLFSGLNSEARNLVPITRYLNAGTISDSKIDSSNYNTMIFYEMELNKWLNDNPNSSLDYKVIPNYNTGELIPRTVTLYWTGFDENGNNIPIILENQGLSTIENTYSTVTLLNVSANATIDYQTGKAAEKQ